MGRDPIWQAIRDEVEREARREPILGSFLHAIVLNHETLEDALSFRLAGKLESPNLHAMQVREVIDEALAKSPEIGVAVRADLNAVRARDPACTGLSEPLLYFKGFHAIQSYRVGHWLWGQGRQALALHLQNRISEVFSVDVHPGARIGSGIFIDHGTGVVIGETAVVEDDVSMLHEVTLGGTGKQTGDRHPKVRRGVLLSVGAKVLGNVTIGEGAKIGAGSVVLEDIPPHTTAVGVPARVVGTPASEQPALEMDHNLPGTGGDGI
ncbi:MAG: serine O-acetyltransferase [Deltaproteobacteria bacterium]|nr:serine O-acetyltransferase [Deltaproteobacteria bacterium]MBW2413703.1 serine O-acetyltransferase [Deltaproteobacteria bacterium]